MCSGTVCSGTVCSRTDGTLGYTVAPHRRTTKRLTAASVVLCWLAAAGCGGIAPATPASATKAVCASMDKLQVAFHPPNGGGIDLASVSRIDHRLLGELEPLGLGGPATVAQQQIGEDANALTRQVARLLSGRGDEPEAAMTITKIRSECRVVRH